MRQGDKRRMLPYFVEFVKFCTGFTVIVASALIALHFASAGTVAP